MFNSKCFKFISALSFLLLGQAQIANANDTLYKNVQRCDMVVGVVDFDQFRAGPSEVYRKVKIHFSEYSSCMDPSDVEIDSAGRLGDWVEFECHAEKNILMTWTHVSNLWISEEQIEKSLLRVKQAEDPGYHTDMFGKKIKGPAFSLDCIKGITVRKKEN